MARLNYTGRRQIDRDRIDLMIHGTPHDLRLTTRRLHLDGLQLPPTARVVVEAHDKTSYIRFECGQVSVISPLTAAALDEFEASPTIKFRIKVIGQGDIHHGKLLAVADNLRADSVTIADEPVNAAPAGGDSLLPFRGVDLEQLAWRLDIDNDQPEILVNKRLPDWKGFVRSAEFRVLALPAALRQIALWAVRDHDVSSAGPEEAVWPWKRFFERLGCPPAPSRLEESDKHESWADEVIYTFTRHTRLLDPLLPTTATEE